MEQTIQKKIDDAIIWAARRKTLAVGLPTGALLAATILLFFYSQKVEQKQIQFTFESQTDNLLNALSKSFNSYEEIVQNIGSFYAASDSVERNEFDAFVQRALTHYDGIQALEWIPRVSHSKRNEYQQSAIANGFSNFRFKHETKDGKWKASNERWADVYYPVYFMQPIEGNEPALGNDLGSNSTRRAALELSRDTGHPIATAKIKLAQDPTKQAAFLLFSPIYMNNKPTQTVEDRRKYLLGFALGVFRVGDIVKASLGNIKSNKFIVEITDMIGVENHELLYSDKNITTQENSISLARNYQNSQVHEIGGRQWNFTFIATNKFVNANRGQAWWLIASGGLIMTLLLALTLLVITNRSQMIEMQVEERTIELAKANEALEQSNIELQQFAFIASHDLQAPLRGVAGFAQILQKKYKNKELDDKAESYIELIVDAAKKMQTMINDLLTYSRIDARSLPFETISMNDVYENAIKLLSASIEDSNGKVTREELFSVTGDKSQLTQLIQNLIGNSLKYYGDRSPEVHLSAQKNGRDLIFSVKDNGIGIDPDQHERIFEIFRRLHTRQQYPGTGIGLSICRRIIKRHHGRIWLESELGKGTTFYFSVSKGASDNK